MYFPKNLLLIAVLTLIVSTAQARVIYVDKDATVLGANDGTSWFNAYNELFDAINASSAGDTIWVAEGTYLPMKEDPRIVGGWDRDVAFYIPEGRVVLGGFAGNETHVSQRDWHIHRSQLSGDIGAPIDQSDNSRTVVMFDNVSAATVLDGFIIRAGNASDFSSNPNSRPFNHGGGIYNDSSNTTLRNLIIINNYAQEGGGGMYNKRGAPTLVNVAFINNEARSGGGFDSENANGMEMTNMLFVNNSCFGTAPNEGGSALFNFSAAITINNATFYGNTGAKDFRNEAFLNYGAFANTEINNSVFYNNMGDIRNDLGGSYFGNNNFLNLLSDPFFNSADPNGPDNNYGTLDDGLYPVVGSNLIDGGDASKNSLSTDFSGSQRIIGVTIDVGAYESICANTGSILYVDIDATGNNDGQNWTDAFTDLQKAIDRAAICSNVEQIWVAEGRYTPSRGPRHNYITHDVNEYTFHLVPGVAMYGGFDGTETSLADRNIEGRHSVLSGRIGAVSGLFANADHVVYVNSGGADTRLDGFIIRDGWGEGTLGAGMTILGASPTIINCFFIANNDNVCGGLNCDEASPTITNVAFISNSNGTIRLRRSSPVFTNVTITGASGSAALFAEVYSFPEFYNSVFYNNSLGDFNFLDRIYPARVSGTNNYCQAPPPAAGFTQINTSPFAIPGDNNGIDDIYGTDDDGLYPSFFSPLLNSGDNARNSESHDVAGLERISGAVIDVGAYELEVCTRYDTIAYVDVDATGTNTGENWGNAFTDLQAAFDLARSNCADVREIWVAEGVYFPSQIPVTTDPGETTTDRDFTFDLPEGVKIYGGFEADESYLWQRKIESRHSILSGNIGAPSNAGDNTYHVVVSVGNSSSTLLDGFAIKNGRGNDTSKLHFGGIDVNRNAGAGIYTSNSEVMINNVIIANNASTGLGGGMHNQNSNPTLTNVVFSNNTSTLLGGAMGNVSSSPTIINGTFSGNTAQEGGGFYNLPFNSQPILYNTVMYGNTSGVGPDDIRNVSGATVSGADNYTEDAPVAYGSPAGFTQLLADPFKAVSDADGTDNVYGTVDDGLVPAQGGVLINAGNNGNNPLLTDVLGLNRVANSTIDVGAYEFQECLLFFSTLYVDSAATGSNTGESWANAYTSLSTALNRADACSNIKEIWVAKGTYFPGTSPRDTDGGLILTPRDFTFHLADGVAVYGGFENGDTQLSDRDIAANKTILSGDIGTKGNSTDNCYHVVLSTLDDANTRLDGFTIQLGTGGPTTDVRVAGQDIRRSNGCGMYTNNSRANLANLVFYNNNTDLGVGAGLLNVQSNTTLTNVAFVQNSAILGGGTFNAFNGSPKYINTTFTNNNADDGGAMGSTQASATPELYNSVFYNNTALTANADIANLTGASVSGGHNLTETDPALFGSPAGFTQLLADPFANSGDPDGADNLIGTSDDGLLPFPTGVLINAGDNSLNNEDQDVCGEDRLRAAIIDIGAYERQDIPFAVFSFESISSCNPPYNVIFTDLSEGADEWEWQFGDGGTDTTQHPSHEYNSADDFVVTLTITNNGTGLMDTITDTISTGDVVPPVITCRDDTTVASCTAGYTLPDFVASGEVTAFDSCAGVVAITQNPAAGTILERRDDHTITFTASDASGNTASCSFVITVQDNNSYIHETNYTACEFFVSPAGNVYYESGFYIDTFFAVNALGCDSLIGFGLTVYSNDTVGPIYRSGCDSLRFAFGTYYASDTLYINVSSNQYGCTVYYHYILDIDSSVTENAPAITGCDSVFYNGTWYDSSQTVVETYAGAASSGCDSTVVTEIILGENDWVTGPFSDCSEPCDGGTQTRTVTCQDCNGNILADSECSAAGPKPAAVQACNLQPCPVDCVVSAWSDWSACSDSCGGGFQTRSRTILVPAQFGGAPCPDLIETRACGPYACLAACLTPDTTAWSVCDTSCGGGTQTRTIYFVDALGNACDSTLETQACNTQACCENDWVTGPFGACSAPCGGGTQTRTVTCQDCGGKILADSECANAGPKPATSQSCNPDPCCSNDWFIGAWGACSDSCGGGTQTRLVVCQDCNGSNLPDGECSSAGPKPDDTQVCNLQPCPVDCVVSAWSDWSACTDSCGGGVQTRSRTILVPAQFGGAPCPDLVETRTCGPYACLASCLEPVPGPWSSCDTNCGGGTQTRYVYQVDSLGNVCDSTLETQACNTAPCCENDWVTGPFGPCSVTCGGGTQIRTVTCQDCNGNTLPDSECSSAGPKPATSQVCNPQPCPVDCVVSAWSDWSACTDSCSGGVQTRTRTILVPAQFGGAPCPDLVETRTCGPYACLASCLEPVPGPWSSCDTSCGGGTQTRYIYMVDSLGNVCDSTLETQACNTTPCCENDWVTGPFGACSVTCGGGTQIRTVTCQDCNGNTLADGECSSAGPKPATSQVCNPQPCPVDCVVSAWSDWSACTDSCSGGVQTRTRTILVPPANGGADCPVLTETRACGPYACLESCLEPIPGPWSNCTPACGIGAQTRYIYQVDSLGNVCDSTLETRICTSSNSTIVVDLDSQVFLLYGPGQSGCVTLSPNSVSGGVLPYSYLWSTGETSASITVCTTDSTTYYLTVTDVSGCTAVDSITVIPIDVSCGKGDGKVLVCMETGNDKMKTLCISEQAAAQLVANHPSAYYGRCNSSSAKMQADSYEPIQLSAYPNPFTQQFYLEFTLPYASQVRIELYDISGKLIRVMFDDMAEAGDPYQLEFNSGELPDGMLIYRMQTEQETLTGRIVKISR